MRTPNLKFILESILEADTPTPMTREEKQNFMQEIANFSVLGESVYGKGDLERTCERVKNIVERANRIMTESDDWLQNVSHKKGDKRMHEDFKDFMAAAEQLEQAQQQMSIAYENIGQHLNRYFDVN